MADEPVLVGLVGLGRWGRRLARTLASSPDVRLVRVSTHDPSRVRDLGLSCEIVTDPLLVLRAHDVDAVVLAVPPRIQPALIHEAISAEHPVLAEKPLALSVTEAEEIAAHAAERAVFVLVDHTQLFSPAYEALRALVDGREVREIEATAGGRGPIRRDIPVLWDWGPHDVALCLDLLGRRPERATARVLERRSVDGALGESVELLLEFGPVLRARCTVSNIAKRRRRVFRARLDHETLTFEDENGHRLVREGSGGSELIPTSPERPLDRVVTAFIRGVRGRAVDGRLAFAVDVVRTLTECERTLAQR